MSWQKIKCQHDDSQKLLNIMSFSGCLEILAGISVPTSVCVASVSVCVYECVYVAELTPTWTQTRHWPTWLCSARGNCAAIGFCSQPHQVSGASHNEPSVTLAGVKPTPALAAVQVHWPPSHPLPLHWHWQRAHAGEHRGWFSRGLMMPVVQKRGIVSR